MRVVSGVRCGDVEWNAVIVRQYRQAIGANLVGDVTVGSDAIGPDPYGVDLALRHQTGRHGVTNQSVGDTQFTQLPGGQPAALQ
ncbi:hypothetical protein D3C78_1636540 [compost metagenome]